MAKVGIEDDCKDMVIHNTEDEYNCAHINAEMENGGKVFGNQAEFDFCCVAQTRNGMDIGDYRFVENFKTLDDNIIIDCAFISGVLLISHSEKLIRRCSSLGSLNCLL